MPKSVIITQTSFSISCCFWLRLIKHFVFFLKLLFAYAGVYCFCHSLRWLIAWVQLQVKNKWFTILLFILNLFNIVSVKNWNIEFYSQLFLLSQTIRTSVKWIRGESFDLAVCDTRRLPRGHLPKLLHFSGPRKSIQIRFERLWRLRNNNKALTGTVENFYLQDQCGFICLANLGMSSTSSSIGNPVYSRVQSSVSAL